MQSDVIRAGAETVKKKSERQDNKQHQSNLARSTIARPQHNPTANYQRNQGTDHPADIRAAPPGCHPELPRHDR